MILNEDEKYLVKRFNNIYKEAVGHGLAEWQVKDIILRHRLRKQRPHAKIIMGRNGPRIIDFKEGGEDKNENNNHML